MNLLLYLQTAQQKGGVARMEAIATFFVSVAAGVVSYYICKWTDRTGEITAVLKFEALGQHPQGFFFCVVRMFGVHLHSHITT